MPKVPVLLKTEQHISFEKRKVLAFDIGIKNLAFCILENQHVLSLHNVNLLDPVEPIFCGQCKAKASYRVGESVHCKRHVPKTHTIIPELSKKIPSNKVMKELIKTHNCEAKGSTNEKCIEALAARFALPVTQPKSANASNVSQVGYSPFSCLPCKHLQRIESSNVGAASAQSPSSGRNCFRNSKASIRLHFVLPLADASQTRKSGHDNLVAEFIRFGKSSISLAMNNCMMPSR